MESDLTPARIAENEFRFREANEQIELAAERASLADGIPFLCECPRLACSELIRIGSDVYEEIRSNPVRFFTVPGHQDICVGLGVGVVVDEQVDYVVIDKVGEWGRVAAENYRTLSD